MDRRSVTLWNAQQAYQAILELWQWVKPLLMAGYRIELIAKRATRSTQANALLHLLIGAVADQMEWAGSRRDAEVWKRLLVASWCRARGDPVQILPALDGAGVDIVFRRTSEMSSTEVAELIEFIYAWSAGVGVKLPADPRQD